MTMMIHGAMLSGGAAAVSGMVNGSQGQASGSKGTAGGFAALLGNILGSQEGESAEASVAGNSLLAMLAVNMLGSESDQQIELTMTDAEIEDALAQLEQLLMQYTAETGENPVDALLGLPVIANWMAQVMQLQQAMGETAGAGGDRSAMALMDGETNESLSKLMALVQWLDRAAATQSGNQQLQGLQSALQKVIMPVLEHAAKSIPELHQMLGKFMQIDSGSHSAEHAAIIRRGNADNLSAEKQVSGMQGVAAQSSQPARDGQSALPRISIVDLQGSATWSRQPFMQQAVQSTPVAGSESVLHTQLTQEEASQPLTTAHDVKPAMTAEAAKPAAPVVHASQLAKDMGDLMVKQLSFQKGDGFSEAKITLMPEHLGQVTVKLAMVNGQLTAQFIADTFVGRELLDSQLSQLRASLQNQGIQVEKLEVTHNSSASAFFQDQRDRDPSQQFQRPQQNKSAGYGDWDDSLDAALEESAQSTWLRSGTSFEVTA